jgi:hypothetical protein
MLAWQQESCTLSIDEYTRELVIEHVLTGVSLEGLKLKGLDLSRADLRGGRLSGTHFRYSDLSGADLRAAELREANLRHVNLKNANLAEADLRGADFTHADVHGAIFTDALLLGAKFGQTRGLSRKVFFPQPTLDKLLGDGKGTLATDVLEVPGRGERWQIVPAARILSVDVGTDRRALLHRAVSEFELREQGLELMGDTAVDAETDTVYRLMTGFLGDPLHAEKSALAASGDSTESTEPTAPRAEEKKSDQEAINDFLMKRLTST